VISFCSLYQVDCQSIPIHLATFAPTGPKQCSELDVVQYDSDKIIQLLGVDFKLIKTTNEAHPKWQAKNTRLI
jgi:hypothetical protein